MIDKLKSILRSIFMEPSELHAQRVNVCMGCKYHKWMKVPGMDKQFMTCGTPITGETIVYRGEEAVLCGCVINQKARDPLAKCPIDKWLHLDETKKSTEKDGVLPQ